MRKKELIKRIEILEKQIHVIPSLSDVSLKVKDTMRNDKDFYYNSLSVSQLSKALSIYKDVLFRAGIISPCDANRTEFQWDESDGDKLGRNFHFKVNEVVIK